MPKSKLVLLVPALLILSLVGFVAYRLISSSSTEEATPPPAKRQIINALPIPDRPFITLFPHQTNKLITLYMDKPGNTPSLLSISSISRATLLKVVVPLSLCQLNFPSLKPSYWVAVPQVVNVALTRTSAPVPLRPSSRMTPRSIFSKATMSSSMVPPLLPTKNSNSLL